jgi:hypothetical protein
VGLNGYRAVKAAQIAIALRHQPGSFIRFTRSNQILVTPAPLSMLSMLSMLELPRFGCADE